VALTAPKTLDLVLAGFRPKTPALVSGLHQNGLIRKR
jgi:hypothetical protein